ncbi:hypothetical protein CYY_005181 [Polysphondylium violaceum]|uniref:Uncharacterized protein n=1 Tax=Polysphondylium violaceum TaxID=133409 RepID=A0A8J4PUP6_9MYCE|nr:hypothetical protein CYY_005181 [Polysphondylium violaceum]
MDSFRITLDHIKEDLKGLERLDENKHFQDLILNFKKRDQDKSSNQENDNSQLDQQQQQQKTYDIFDLILNNVNIDEIENDYLYIREIDYRLIQNDIKREEENDRQEQNNSNSSTVKDNADKNNNNSSSVDDNDDDQDNDTSSNSSKNSLDNQDNQKDEKIDIDNEMKKEIKENKQKMIKTLIELGEHDDVFNEAFKYIDTNKWLKSKGLDIVSETGSLHSDINSVIQQLENSIKEINNLSNQPLFNDTHNSSSSSSTSIKGQDEESVI